MQGRIFQFQGQRSGIQFFRHTLILQQIVALGIDLDCRQRFITQRCHGVPALLVGFGIFSGFLKRVDQKSKIFRIIRFPADGFAYSHYHEDGHCGLVAEEAVSLDLPDVSSTFADLALFWTKFADMNVYCDRLDQLIGRLGVTTIAPTHGLPITDVKATVPKVQEGLKAAALMPESGTNEQIPLR